MTFYAYFVLVLVTLVRCCFIVQKNTLGYAFGFDGVGDRANNPTYMIKVAFPELVQNLGLIGSALFGISYCTSNVIMSFKAKTWNNKNMLTVALMGMCLSMFGTSAAPTVGFFALNRFLFGAFAAAINAPIYQLIATTIPQKYRSTANAI